MDKREFLCSKAMLTRFTSALGSDKGCLPAVALEAMASLGEEGELEQEQEQEQEQMSGGRAAGIALRVARKASSSTMVEASALSVLLHLPAIAHKLIDKADCWGT